MSLQTGQILQGRYSITSHIGQGGMGTVYQARDMRLNNRLVAVKELDPAHLPLTDQQTAVHAFQREADILATLSHPGLTAVHDYFPENNKFYLVMEFVQGETLQQAWERVGQRFAEAQVVAWAHELCDVLSYLHSQRPPIIFRDLKPGNIMVQPNGRLKLIDFGIARHFDPAKTRDTTRFGTPGYAAPEQYGQGQTDARSDVYALGVVVHQLLTGYDPGNTPFNLPDIASFSIPLSSAVMNAVRQAVKIDPQQRPPDIEAWRQLLVGKTAVADSTTPAKTWFWAAGGIAGLVLLVVGSFMWWNNQATAEPTPTPQMVAVSSRDTTPEPVAIPILAFTPTSESLPTSTTPPTSTPQPTETASPTPTITISGDGRRETAVFIPAGNFTMGTDADLGYAECEKLLLTEACQRSWFVDEEPVHTVNLDAFYIDPYEVSNAAFVNFLNGQANPQTAGNDWLDLTAAGGQGPLWFGNGRWQISPGLENHPVSFVNWYGARAYCGWQNGRLPTEAEWEKAARGADDARLYPWGDTFAADKANICDTRCQEAWANRQLDDGYATTSPVGSYPGGVSPYGLYDMSGNVFEWTTDWYAPDYYAQSPDANPTGPSSGERYVVRGGSWQRNGRGVRLSYRYSYKAAFGYSEVGFRCVYDR
jgi:formylglycine-generating enzyme required for sulfatase activity